MNARQAAKYYKCKYEKLRYAYNNNLKFECATPTHCRISRRICFPFLSDHKAIMYKIAKHLSEDMTGCIYEHMNVKDTENERTYEATFEFWIVDLKE